MTPENFVYWLNGFVELTGDKPSEEQWESIKNHLALVLKKVINPVFVVKNNILKDVYNPWKDVVLPSLPERGASSSEFICQPKERKRKTVKAQPKLGQ